MARLQLKRLKLKKNILSSCRRALELISYVARITTLHHLLIDTRHTLILQHKNDEFQENLDATYGHNNNQ